MTNHSPEPWRHTAVAGGWDGVKDRDGTLLCSLNYNNPENATRIAACVNACEGISTEALNGNVVKNLMEAAIKAEELLSPFQGSGFLGERALDGVRAAIAKATGEPA